MFKIEKKVSNVTLFKLSGDFNITDYKQFKEHLNDIITDYVIIDFDDVTYVNSSMISVIIQLTKTRKVALYGCSPQFLEVLELFGVQHLVPIYKSKEQLEHIITGA